jgi:hypothetical protein
MLCGGRGLWAQHAATNRVVLAFDIPGRFVAEVYGQGGKKVTKQCAEGLLSDTAEEMECPLDFSVTLWEHWKWVCETEVGRPRDAGVLWVGLHSQGLRPELSELASQLSVKQSKLAEMIATGIVHENDTNNRQQATAARRRPSVQVSRGRAAEHRHAGCSQGTHEVRLQTRKPAAHACAAQGPCTHIINIV